MKNTLILNERELATSDYTGYFIPDNKSFEPLDNFAETVCEGILNEIGQYFYEINESFI